MVWHVPICCGLICMWPTILILCHGRRKKLYQTSFFHSIHRKHIISIPKKLPHPQKQLTIVRISHCGGIGAIDYAFIWYFHPSQHVCDDYPNKWKTKQFSYVTIMREENETVHHKEQQCYFCNVPGINHILQITSKSKITCHHFEAKHHQRNAPGEITEAKNSIDNWQSLQNVDQNVVFGQSTNEDIIGLCHHGIQVNNNNELAPENAWVPLQQSTTVGKFFTPTISPWNATGMVMYKQNKWNTFSWDAIWIMSDFDLFHLSFPKAYIIDVIIPATNKQLTNHLTLQEFYCWLGCNFLMCFFEGVADQEHNMKTAQRLPLLFLIW